MIWSLSTIAMILMIFIVIFNLIMLNLELDTCRYNKGIDFAGGLKESHFYEVGIIWRYYSLIIVSFALIGASLYDEATPQFLIMSGIVMGCITQYMFRRRITFTNASQICINGGLILSIIYVYLNKN